MLKNIFICITLILLAGCSNEQSDPLKGQFLSGCMQGSTQGICECVYDTIAKQRSKKEIFNLFTDFKYFDQLQDAILSSQKACLL
jgi:hypothetical protein